MIRSFLRSESAGRILHGKRFAAFAVCRRGRRGQPEDRERARNRTGGEYVDGIHFRFAGGQVRSLLSLISYLGKGENRERYPGVSIPPTNLKPDYLDAVRTFASQLPDRLGTEARRS